MQALLVLEKVGGGSKIGRGNHKSEKGTVNRRGKRKVKCVPETTVTAIATTEITGLGIE
jgi:hypothetical protein